MKKILSLLLAASLTLAMGACSSTGEPSTSTDPSSTEPSSTEPSSEDAGEKKVLKVGTSADYPPFEYHANIDGKDTIVGVDIDLANYIADELGYELQIVDMGFDGLIGNLNEGSFDMVMAGFTVDPTRDCLFSIPYYGFNNAILTTPENKETFNTIESLKDIKLGALLGSTQEDLAKEYAGEKALIIPNFQDGVMMVQEGGLDAIICESVVAEATMAKNDKLVMTDLIIEVEDSSVAIGFKKGNEELADQINVILQQAMDSGLIDELMVKHLAVQ